MATPTPPPDPRTRLPREERRAQVIEAAAGAFLARGYDGTSMDDVAQAAGVSRLIVYRIFESKQELYRAVLKTVLTDLGREFAGLGFDEMRSRGASNVILPVARAHPDAFRLLWRHAWHEPEFADLANQLRSHVTTHSRAALSLYVTDELILDWAARTAGAHLIDGLCNWLDAGDPERDAEFGDLVMRGMRAMASAWADSPGRRGRERVDGTR